MAYQPPPNPVDLSLHWDLDSEYDGFFQKGARTKSIHRSPKKGEKYIKPDFRYLFKESIERHPVQFWSEIIAYRIGKIIGVKVPPAFAAIWQDTFTGKLKCGSLIEWFYDENSSTFLEYKEAGEFLSLLRPGFDRKKGVQHNFRDNLSLLDNIDKHEKFTLNDGWFEEFVSIFLFDTIIGNTDRHQDNWGIVIEKKSKSSNNVKISPAYDNGTSLCYEILDDNIINFSNRERRLVYIKKGTHHVSMLIGEKKVSHIDFIKNIISLVPGIKEYVVEFFNIDISLIDETITELTKFSIPVCLKNDRAEMIINLIKDRITLVRQELI